MNSQDVINQSKGAYNQWCKQWRDHAKQHAQFAPHKSLKDFSNIGVGKACLAVANGYTFEENIDTIKKYKDNVDILCCDKTLGHLLDNGITPAYCIVCDANVNYEKYMEPWKDKLQDTILFINVCGNPKWSLNGNWKDKYFFVCVDAIKSEVEFSGLSNCQNMIPAATNVSNAMIVLLTQSDNRGRRNFFGYDKILLIGFDYCWRHDKKYYAFDDTANGKNHYMRHIYNKTMAGTLAYTSTNLAFSARWLEQYISNFRLPVVQCSRETMLRTQYTGELEKQMQYNFKREDRKAVITSVNERERLQKRLEEINSQLVQVGREHYFSFLSTV